MSASTRPITPEQQVLHLLHVQVRKLSRDLAMALVTPEVAAEALDAMGDDIARTLGADQ